MIVFTVAAWQRAVELQMKLGFTDESWWGMMGSLPKVDVFALS
jgi:hypothetical protein